MVKLRKTKYPEDRKAVINEEYLILIHRELAWNCKHNIYHQNEEKKTQNEHWLEEQITVR